MCSHKEMGSNLIFQTNRIFFTEVLFIAFKNGFDNARITIRITRNKPIHNTACSRISFIIGIFIIPIHIYCVPSYRRFSTVYFIKRSNFKVLFIVNFQKIVLPYWV